MESPNNNNQTEKRKFRLYEHPWLSLLAVVVTTVVSIILASNLVMWIGLSLYSPTGEFANAMTFHILTVFFFVPVVLRLPKGKRTFGQYLDDIGLTRVQPFVRLVLLGLSCYVILALSQAAASFVYRFSEGLPITWSFVRRVFDLSGDLPPGSSSLLVSFPSIFEEAVFRGIVLTVFLGRYSERKAIIFSALGFGLMHLFNLASGRELVWVLGQVVWAFILGLFYGYLFIKTRSLLPPMIFHYLGNVFIGSLTGYMQSRASIEMQTLYGIIFSLGIVPTTLMILWTRFFSSRWLTSAVVVDSKRTIHISK
ncbi:MAG: CPBP family intramembrane metalloprotease [Anaerolineaceae bacterium]|nr:MAG: CPBP family intramembrane metalloprotease [Anaerolineaceae bacterium]